MSKERDWFRAMCESYAIKGSIFQFDEESGEIPENEKSNQQARQDHDNNR